MFRKCLFLVTVVLMAATIVFAQGTFKPRDADEAHAWRLYNQYKQSKQQVTKLEKGIKQTSDDIRSVSHGSLGALGASPEDVTALAKMRKQLAAENARQKNLEAAWHRKFYGRYRDLADGYSKTIYDAKTKRNMDGIEFGLRYSQFNVNNDGVYSGIVNFTGYPVSTEPDKIVSIKFTIAGSSIDGEVSGGIVYKPKNDFPAFYSMMSYFKGTVGSDGQISILLSNSKRDGTLTGNVAGGKASGIWEGHRDTHNLITWTAHRK